jgi:hypothetical protein
MSITEKPGDPNPISNMPKAHNRLATKASLREHRKKKSAAKKTTLWAIPENPAASR